MLTFRKLYKAIVNNSFRPQNPKEMFEAHEACRRKAECLRVERERLNAHIFTPKMIKSGKSAKFSIFSSEDSTVKGKKKVEEGPNLKGRPWAAKLFEEKTLARMGAVGEAWERLRIVENELRRNIA